MQEEKNKINVTKISGHKSQMNALASEAIDKLTQYITKSTPKTGIQLGIIENITLGPPMTTLTINLNGEDVPNIRFISNGVTPDIGDTAVVVLRGNNYICIGVLE